MGNSPGPYFVSLAVRKIVLRIIIMSSLSSFVTTVIIGAASFHEGDTLGTIAMSLAIIPLSVLLHHILRLWPRKKWSVRSDFIYSTAELCFVTGYLIFGIISIPGEYINSFSIMVTILLALLWSSLAASFVFTIWNLRASQYRTIRSTYDFIGNYDHMVTGVRKSKIGRWSLLFGENICRKRFGIDRVVVRGLRAGISILCLLGMIALGYLVLIIQPMQQQLYSQTTHTSDYSGYADGNVTMRVTPAIDKWDESVGLQQPLDSYVMNITWQPESRQVLCENIDGLGATCNVQSPFNHTSPDNLVITIDYTHALQNFSVLSLRTGVYLTFNTGVNVLDETSGILPIQLYPGFHLFGTTFYSFRETYASSTDLAFGIPNFNRHLVANVQALIPDPEFTNSNLDNTTATLRLTYKGGLHSIQTDFQVEREQPSNTVVSGFAQLGGVWTFISGLFAMVFGCRLLLVLFGIKPLSIYGLIHLFQSRRSLVDGGYTLSAEEQSRTIAVLREHLLDEDDRDMEAGEVDEDKDQDDEERRKLHDAVQ